MTKKGFTLIELLVVISILGILAGLTLSSYSASQKQARDSERRSDLNQYRNSLEVYAGANNMKYPGFTTRASAFTTLCPELSGLIGSCLIDPLPTEEYYYRYRSNGDNSGDATATQYVLWAKLETGACWEVCSGGKTGKLAACPAADGDADGACQVP